MPRLKKPQTNFTGGWVDPGLFGRFDFRAYTNGAAKLENVFVKPLGGVTRRPGMKYIGSLPGETRMVAFEFSTNQTYLVAFSNLLATVYRNGVVVATLATPWPETQLKNVAWTQSADTLLVVHPSVPPKKITRTSDTDWTIEDWSYSSEDDDATKRIYQPHSNFPIDEIKLTPAAGSGSGIALTADADLFVDDHVGTRFRIRDKEVEIASVVDGQNATIDIIQTIPKLDGTLDWTEQAFSAVRGWPYTVTFHQDRLVIGGSRDAPNNLWLSKSSEFFNFDLGEALDDESIDAPIVSDQVNAIRGVFSGRDLQVFTSGAEWRVTGDPLTPDNVQIKRQTRLGSRVDRYIPPVDIDGATVFIPRLDDRPREFLFLDVEQAYTVTDLAIVSAHLLGSPVRTAYDQNDRLFHVVNGNGTMATVTVYRNEEVTAWTLQETDGLITDVETVLGETFVAVNRDGVYSLEKLVAGTTTDASVSASADVATDTWAGLDHLNGKTVTIVADGYVHQNRTVFDGQVVLDSAVTSTEIGLPYTHSVWPLPMSMYEAQDSNVGLRIRPVAVRLKLLNTKALSLDIGDGAYDKTLRRFGADTLDQPLQAFTGDVTYRMRGWRNSDDSPFWKIEQNLPMSFELLSAITEINLND